MSQDRQTDKSTWWSVTAFEESERSLLSGDVFPPFVVRVFGGLEECPDTKRIHFQGAVQCKGQQRFSAMKKWLPKAHLEAARSADALRKYAMKEETAISEKKEVVNKAVYIDNQAALYLLAREKIDYGFDEMVRAVSDRIRSMPENQQKIANYQDNEFSILANRIVYREPHLVGVMSKPDISRGWKMFGDTFVRLVNDGRGDSITPRPQNVVVEEEEEDSGEE